MQNISSGGVGEAYPGSTGGEFFNYYGTDNNKNEASGDYSSTFGYNNKNTAPKLLMCGSNNQTPEANTNANGGLIAGYNNIVRAIDGAAICLGGNNTVYGNNQIFIGYDNHAQGSVSPKSICIGRGLTVSFSNLKQKVVLGTYNKDAATLTSENKKLQTIIGGGDSQSLGHQHNAMEVYSSLNNNKCCVLFPEQIALSNYTTSNKAYVNAIDPPQDPTNPTTNEQTLATLGSFQKRYQSWYSSIVFTPDVAKSTADLPSGFQAALYQATEAEFTGTYWGVQVRAKFRLSPNSDETILANPVVCYNTDGGAYSHSRGFILKLEKSSSAVTITMQKGTSIDFGNNDNTFNSYVDSTTTFNVSYIQLKMTNF